MRFVNTPAIIERFATLEKEILQIEHSIQANEIANAADAEQIQDGIHFVGCRISLLKLACIRGCRF